MLAWSFGLLVFVLFIFFASIPVGIHLFFSPLPKMNWVRDSWGIWQFLQLADRKVSVLLPKKCDWTAAAVTEEWRSYMKSICSSEREQESSGWGGEVMQWHLWTEKEKRNIGSVLLNIKVGGFFGSVLCRIRMILLDENLLECGHKDVGCSTDWCKLHTVNFGPGISLQLISWIHKYIRLSTISAHLTHFCTWCKCFLWWWNASDKIKYSDCR